MGKKYYYNCCMKPNALYSIVTVLALSLSFCFSLVRPLCVFCCML